MKTIIDVLQCHIKRITLFFAVILVVTVLQAQENRTTVVGKVIGSDSIPLIGVGVIMQNLDSTFINATTTDSEGYFRLKYPNKPYRILFQHIAYEPYSIEPSSNELGTIMLKDAINELKGIVVTAERPLLKVEDSRLTYDLVPLMKNRIIDNAYDLLKELPSIRSDGNALTLNGAAGETNIIINGKTSNMSVSQLNDYLKSLPAERVEKAEIVYNPPPQWHVKGVAINVILKKSDQYNLQGQIQGIWNNTHDNSYTGNGSLFISNKKASFDLLYSYKNNSSVSRSTTYSRHTVDEEIYNIESSSNEKTKNQSHNIYSNISYNLTEKSSLSLTYNGQLTPKTNEHTSSLNNMFADALSNDEGNNNLHDVRLTYDAPFGLSIGSEYTYYNNEMKQNMQYIKEEQDNETAFIYNREQQINQTAFFADMAHHLSHNWNLSYGANYKYTKNKNTQIYDDEQNNGKDSYNQTSTTEETTANLYIGAKKSFFKKKLSIDFSLTGELYKINDYKKNALLPNTTITYVPASKHILQLSYNTVRRYPSYWQRQDYVSYNDEYSVSYGNPTLRPAKTSYINLLYVLNNKYMLQVSYYKVNDFFISQSYQSTEKLQLIHKTFNIDYTTAFNTSLIIPVKVSKVFSSNIIASAYNERYKNNEWFDISYDRNKWTGSLMANNTIVVSQKPNVTINAMAFYRTPTIQGIWNLSDNWAVNAGIKWAFAGKKAILSFQCDDIFESMMPTIKVRYGKQYQDINTNFYRRSFSLAFTYKFNDYKNKQKKSIDTSRFGTD